jgi:hypothetical protein
LPIQERRGSSIGSSRAHRGRRLSGTCQTPRGSPLQTPRVRME